MGAPICKCRKEGYEQVSSGCGEKLGWARDWKNYNRNEGKGLDFWQELKTAWSNKLG